MEKTNGELNSKLKFGLKSFITICAILFGIVIFVGILTFIIPAGRYQRVDGVIDPNAFEFISNTTRLPVYRWFTVPIEAIIFGEGNFSVIQIIAVLLVLGGTFKVLDKTGGLYAIVRVIVDKFYYRRYLSIWIITLAMMTLSSCFGLQEELLIMFPVFLSFSKAMKWGKVQAVSLVLVTTGVGFTTALFNPFTIGVASNLAGVSILSGIWFRILIFAIIYVLTSLYLIYCAKKDEKRASVSQEASEFKTLTETEKIEYLKKAKLIFILFAVALFVIIITSLISFLSDLGMVFMAVTFIIGTFLIGNKLLNGFKNTAKTFFSGAKDLSPSIIMLLLAFSVKYVADKGNILETIFYYFHSYMNDKSPYVTVVLLYLLVLVFEFFIPGSMSKALLLIPLLTLAPFESISVNVIILAYLFGDGYTNVLFPTCSTLVVGLSVAEVSYTEWLKKTFPFQIALFIVSVLLLIFAVYIGL